MVLVLRPLRQLPDPVGDQAPDRTDDLEATRINTHDARLSCILALRSFPSTYVLQLRRANKHGISTPPRILLLSMRLS